MSDMKCPFCQRELRNCCAGVIYTCSKPDSCPHEQCYGSKELWQELIRTRKALEIAVDAMKYANKCIKGGCVNWETEIDKALDKIKTLTKGGDNE